VADRSGLAAHYARLPPRATRAPTLMNPLARAAAYRSGRSGAGKLNCVEVVMDRAQGPGVPDGYNSVSPWVISRDTNAVIEFAKAAFGADEIGRVADENGVIGHAEFRIGDSVVLAFDAKPHWPDTPAFLRLYVEDADATFQRALDAGGIALTNVTHLFWGDRIGRVRDPMGNLWWIQARVEEVDEAEINRRMSDPVWLERMAYVQSVDPFAKDAQ
jgi:PhnB protein